MIKKIYNYLIMLTVLAAVACSDDSVGIANYTRKIDLSASTLADYQNDAALLYSTDEGKTFVGFPKLTDGQTYQVKAVYNPDPDSYTFPDEQAIAEITACPFTIDWSSSDPQPISVDNVTGIATFAVGGKNMVSVKVTNIPSPVNDVVGTYEVVTDEWVDFHKGDHLTVEKIDDTHIRIVEYPATDSNHAPLVVTFDPATGAAEVEDQDNGKYTGFGEAHTSGSGTVYVCAKTIDLTIDFVVDGQGDQGEFKLSLKKI